MTAVGPHWKIEAVFSPWPVGYWQARKYFGLAGPDGWTKDLRIRYRLLQHAWSGRRMLRWVIESAPHA